MTKLSPVVVAFEALTTSAYEIVESYASTSEVIECLSRMDELRRRLDRLTLDPTRRPS